MRATLIVLLFCLAGCGTSSRDSEAIGQVKKVAHQTPLICPNFYAVDLSLGVMRNGVGSMSSQDQWFYVSSPDQVALLQKAGETGGIVKLKYDVARVTFCVPDHQVTSVELVK